MRRPDPRKRVHRRKGGAQRKPRYASDRAFLQDWYGNRADLGSRGTTSNSGEDTSLADTGLERVAHKAARIVREAGQPHTGPPLMDTAVADRAERWDRGRVRHKTGEAVRIPLLDKGLWRTPRPPVRSGVTKAETKKTSGAKTGVQWESLKREVARWWAEEKRRKANRPPAPVARAKRDVPPRRFHIVEEPRQKSGFSGKPRIVEK